MSIIKGLRVMSEEHFDDDYEDAVSSEILIVAPRTDLLTDCIKDILQRFLPTFQVTVCDPGPRLLEAMSRQTRLVICYKLEVALISELSRRLRNSGRRIAIGIFAPTSGPRDLDYRSLARQQLIDGIFPSATRLDIFLIAVDLLLKGGEFFPADMIAGSPRAEAQYSARNFAPGYRSVRQDRGIEDAGIALTSREKEILELMSEGTQNKIIAARLDLSENTVKVHVRSIYRKMQVRNRTEAVSQFFRSIAERSTSRHFTNAPRAV